MEAFALIAGLLYTAVVGYIAMDRLGRFLDNGGISPDWEEADTRGAQKEPVNPDGSSGQEGCNPPHSKVV